MKVKLFLLPIYFFLNTVPIYAKDLVITEVLPNPIGDDKTGEFIEVYNNSEDSIEISTLGINGQPLAFYDQEQFILEHNEFLIIHDDEIDIKKVFSGNYKRAVVESLTSRGLSNTSDSIVLEIKGEVIDSLEYTQSMEGVSIVRPLIDCEFLTESKTLTNSNTTSIGQFENIFEFEELEIYPEFQTTEWGTSLTYSALDSLNFRLKYNNTCNFEISEFEYTIDSSTKEVNEINTINFNKNELNIKILTIQHTPTNSTTLLTLEVDNTSLIPTPTITSIPTIIPTPSPIPTITPVPEKHTTYENIKINEVYAVPDSNENEWIELYNYGNEKAELTDYILSDKTSSQNLRSLSIEPNEFLVIKDPELSISLNNGGDELELKNPEGKIISTFIYGNTPKLHSQILIEDEIRLSTFPTMGSKNIYKRPEEEPKNEKNPKQKVTNSHITNVTNHNYTDIRINEIYATPESNNNEWIELYNFGDKNISLSGWGLTDKNNKQKLNNYEIESHGFLVLEGDDLKITLNNSGDLITLTNPSNEVIHQVEYPDSEKGKSYAYILDSFVLTQHITKGEENSVTYTDNGKKEDDVENSTLEDISKEKPQNDAINAVYLETPISSQTNPNFKLPKKYAEQIEKPETVEETPTQSQNVSTKSKQFLFKDTSLLILGGTGFANTTIGKELIKVIMKKLETMGA